MTTIKKIAALGVASCLVLALVACSGGVSRKDASVYIQGRLDAQYKGEFSQAYIDLVEDMTQADAEELYNDNLAFESEYMLNFLESEYTSDSGDDAMQTMLDEIYADALVKARAVVGGIYAQSKYTVGEADKLKSGDFAVEVVVSPIEITNLISSETFSETFDSALEAAGITSQDEMDAMSDEAFYTMDAAYTMEMLNLLEELIPQISYGKDQIIMMQMKLDDKDYYTLTDAGVQRLDEVMIDYTGAYAE